MGRVAAGAIARKLLAREGVKIVGYTKELGTLVAEQLDFDEITAILYAARPEYGPKNG